MFEKNKLYLYEALELRSEYDARIRTFKDCLPESRQNRDRSFFSMEDNFRHQPAPDFDVADVRWQLGKLEVKRRKLNTAIQQANFDNRVEFRGESINLNEALEARKELNEQIGDLRSQVVNSACVRIICKEGREIVEKNELSYTECINDLESARLAFRNLNRKLRKASFETLIRFEDE